MMSMKGVMILFALFSIGSLMPAKHWLIETEDSGDDSKGVIETKSKILGFGFHYINILFYADLMENKKWVWVPDEEKEVTDGFEDVTTPSAAIIQQQTKPCTSMVQCACGSCSDDIMIRSGHGDWVREKNQRVKEMLNKS